MNKAAKIFSLFIIISLVLILSLYFLYKNNKIIKQDEILFFYGTTCPHCKNVEDFIKENNLEQKLEIKSFEVYNSKENLNKMLYYARICKINEKDLGVPMIYYNGKCYIGDNECTGLLKMLSGV